MPARFVDLGVIYPISGPSQHSRPVCLHIDSCEGGTPRCVPRFYPKTKRGKTRLSFARWSPGPTDGRHVAPRSVGPLSLMMGCLSSEGRESVKGGPVLAGEANP